MGFFLFLAWLATPLLWVRAWWSADLAEPRGARARRFFHSGFWGFMAEAAAFLVGIAVWQPGAPGMFDFRGMEVVLVAMAAPAVFWVATGIGWLALGEPPADPAGKVRARMLVMVLTLAAVVASTWVRMTIKARPGAEGWVR